MSEAKAVLPLANEETARLKWFEAFMRRRVELEQQTYANGIIVHEPATECLKRISSLQVLLEGAPPLPERKMLWHGALEGLLDGTRDELHSRVEELERLKDQMNAMEMSIAKTKTCIDDLNLEFEKLESAECIDSARAATATSYKEWLDIKPVDVSVQKILSNLLPSGRARNKKLERETVHEGFKKYYEQDLRYRHELHQQRQNQEQFLNSIPHRVQEYGTEYWTAVRDVGMVMESFASYLRITSSTCNSSGSVLWASAKNIKPLVDANCHTEAIEFAHHQSSIRFTPIYYQNPGSQSYSPHGQTILFGCPLELHTAGELKKIPPILEYLLDSVDDWPPRGHQFLKPDKYWPLVNEIEQAWIGVEESDRAIVSKLDQYDLVSLIVVYLWTLPKPVLSSFDVTQAEYVSQASLNWNTWSKDPIKATILYAILACQARLRHSVWFGLHIADALAQKKTLNLWLPLTRLSGYPELWRAPISNVQDEN